ncbi:hypothetical protein [Myroides sp. DF42-4-2]|uniref:hypothetical protein n=1 Tax=unclassified Myroides TaxID=2642485 RepID=UPI002578CF48|nr:hypothetical protein [Myroides sp. DF42-4-2]MDM1407276.1 hypothetical protein [Myroides sp. DF42-4-2]
MTKVVPLGAVDGGIQGGPLRIPNTTGSTVLEEITINSTGSPKLLSQAFNRFSRFDYHYGKHAEKWGAITKDAYYKRSLSLFDKPMNNNIKGFTNSSGYSFRMNLRTGEFGVMRPNGVIETFFRRTIEPEQYWLNQIAKWGN